MGCCIRNFRSRAATVLFAAIVSTGLGCAHSNPRLGNRQLPAENRQDSSATGAEAAIVDAGRQTRSAKPAEPQIRIEPAQTPRTKRGLQAAKGLYPDDSAWSESRNVTGETERRTARRADNRNRDDRSTNRADDWPRSGDRSRFRVRQAHRTIEYDGRSTGRIHRQTSSGLNLPGSVEWTSLSDFPPDSQTPPKPGVGQRMRVPFKSNSDEKNIELRSDNDLLTLRVREAPLNVVLHMIAREQGLNIVAGGDVNEKISVTLHKVTLRDGLDSLMAIAGCTWTQSGDIIYVSKVKTASKLNPGVQGRQIRVIPLNFLSSSDVEKSVKALLSPVGQVFVTQSDPLNAKRTAEQVVIEDLPPYVSRIVEYIRQIDHPPRQVQIEAHVLQVTLTDEISHGVNFDYLKQVSGGEIALSAVGFANPLTRPAAFFSFDGNSLDSFVELLKRTTQAKTLASPQVMVVNGQQAKIQIGERLGYLVTTTTQTSTLQDVQFLDVGVVLTVTPQITADNQVLMRVKPKVSQGQINRDTGLPQEETTDVETTVMLPDGQGIIIGGLIQEADDDRQSKIPLLGDLWLAGRLFQRRNASKDRTEIIIALVPRIVPYGTPRDECDESKWNRASSRLFHDGLERSYRPSEPELADAVRNPRRPRFDRFKKFFTNLGESHPRRSEYYFPAASHNAKVPQRPLPIRNRIVRPAQPVNEYGNFRLRHP